MEVITTLIPDLRQLLGDELSLIWTTKQLYDALIEAQQEYLRRTRACKVYKTVEPYDYDLNFKLPDTTYNIELAHNDQGMPVDQHDYKSANEIFGDDLENGRPGIPSDLYNSISNTRTEFKTYPQPDGELTIYDESDSFGMTESIEDFKIDGNFGIADDGLGVIARFSNWEGEKVSVNISLKPTTNVVLVRFYDALPFRSVAKLLQIRQETFDSDISEYYQSLFNKYITMDIKLLKRKIGQKTYGGFY